jgi:hypothetical protein
MADLAKRLAGPTSLTATAATVYTVPASTKAIVRNIHVANTSAAVATFTMSIGADAAGTRYYDDVEVPVGGALDWSGFLVLAAAETIQAYSGTASVLTLTISGVEES